MNGSFDVASASGDGDLLHDLLADVFVVREPVLGSVLLAGLPRDSDSHYGCDPAQVTLAQRPPQLVNAAEVAGMAQQIVRPMILV